MRIEFEVLWRCVLKCPLDLRRSQPPGLHGDLEADTQIAKSGGAAEVPKRSVCQAANRIRNIVSRFRVLSRLLRDGLKCLQRERC